MASGWDFISGAANFLLDDEARKMENDRELAKQRAMEALRRDTSDYEYNRARKDSVKAVDPNLSYLDFGSKEYVLVNSEGKEIGRRPATSTELNREQLDQIRIEDAKLGLERNRVGLDMDRKQLRLYGTGGGSGGGRRGSLDSPEKQQAKQQDEMGAAITAMANNLRKYGLDESEVVKFESTARERVATGNWGSGGLKGMAWLRRYEAAFLKNEKVRMKIAERALMKLEEGE